MKTRNLFLSLLIGGSLSAQIQLDTVTVSAALFEQSLMNSNRNVQILSGEELEKAPVNSVAELLDFATGIDARQRGISEPKPTLVFGEEASNKYWYW